MKENVSWLWLSPLQGWDSLTMRFLGKFGFVYIHIHIHYIYIYHYIYISCLSQTWLSIKRIRKFVKQTLCFLFYFYCVTHTHTGFSFIYIYIYIYIHIYIYKLCHLHLDVEPKNVVTDLCQYKSNFKTVQFYYAWPTFQIVIKIS